MQKDPSTDSFFRLHDNVLEPVNEILKIKRACQGNATSSQPSLVSDIVSELDSDVCSRLQIPVYNTLLLLFLQTTKCQDIERGLYLLAVRYPVTLPIVQH
jgi:hypothetical protein